MKHRHYIHKLVVLSLCFIGCMNNQENKNIKNYFFDIDKFDQPMVYEYEYITSNTKYYTYYVYKKIKPDEVEISIINNNFDTVSTFYYLYKNDGVFIKGATNIDLKNNKKIIKENILDSLVFPYQFSNSQFGFSTSCEPKDNSIMTTIVTRKFKDFGTVDFNGENISAIIASGETKVTMKTKDSPEQDWAIVTKENITYGKGYGVISYDSEDQYQTTHMNLKRIISVEEFEKTKNAS